jgi:hypothetical protein
MFPLFRRANPVCSVRHAIVSRGFLAAPVAFLDVANVR